MQLVSRIAIPVSFGVFRDNASHIRIVGASPGARCLRASARFSAPGVVWVLILWIGSTFGARFYFDHVSDYSRSYGPLNGVAMLLLLLYVTNGAIPIGGERPKDIPVGGQVAALRFEDVDMKCERGKERSAESPRIRRDHKDLQMDQIRNAQDARQHQK
jgi:hypothetical protein